MHDLRARSTDHVRRKLLRVWQSRGGGFYGFVAMATFLWLEAVDIAGDLRALPGTASLDIGFIISWIVGNIVDAALNGVWAALWPVSWLRLFGIGLLSAALLGGCYVGYRLVRTRVIHLLTPSGEAPPVLGRETVH